MEYFKFKEKKKLYLFEINNPNKIYANKEFIHGIFLLHLGEILQGIPKKYSYHL